MPTTWNQVYLNVCDILLESGGLQTGTYTLPQFLVLAGEVLTDFLNKTGVIKKLSNTQIQFGVDTYPIPSTAGDIDAAWAAQTWMAPTSGWYLDNTNTDWMSFYSNGQPQAYREDELPPKNLQVYPTPNVDGNDVGVAFGLGGYGVLCQTQNVVDFDFTVSPYSPQPGYGIICGSTGNPYLETINQGYGIFSYLMPSTGNVAILADALPFSNNVGLTGYLELLPDSLVPYIKYGILAQIFTTDSEVKSAQKAAYCNARYQEGINMMAALMSQEYQEG